MTKKKNVPFIFWQTVLVSGIILGTALLLTIWGGNRLVGQMPDFGPSLRTALMLFVLWLVVSSGVRSLHSLYKKFSFGSLFAGGVSIGLLGSLICFSLVRVIGFFVEESTLSRQYDARNMLFFAGLGVVVALLSAINLRTANRTVGNILEVIVVIALILSMLYFS